MWTVKKSIYILQIVRLDHEIRSSYPNVATEIAYIHFHSLTTLRAVLTTKKYSISELIVTNRPILSSGWRRLLRIIRCIAANKFQHSKSPTATILAPRQCFSKHGAVSTVVYGLSQSAFLDWKLFIFSSAWNGHLNIEIRP